MIRVAVDDLVQGMRLERPVTNKSGMVMLGEGTELSARLIEKIKNMGISSACVCGTGKAFVPKEEALAGLDDRFIRSERMPYMGMLKKLMKEHIEGLYEEHGSGGAQE
jgi:hypothetical protein